MMVTPDDKKRKLIGIFDEMHEKWAIETWKFINEYGPEKWTEGYVLSHQDKLDQIDALIKYFEELEEYEICEYLVAIKTTTNKKRYML